MGECGHSFKFTVGKKGQISGYLEKAKRGHSTKFTQVKKGEINGFLEKAKCGHITKLRLSPFY
jgi:hypothetical protein